MPLVKRSIEPSAISHGAIGSDVRNELECVSNNTLSKIIKQLGSLSKQSEDLFAELYVETCTLANRTTNLGRRIDGLKQKICQLNPIVEEVSLQEINQRKPFKSVMCRDQQIMLRSTRPHSIAEVYKMCEMPPALNKLDVFREDGMDSLKFYTNPEYFAELWFAEMKAAQHQQKKIKQKHSQLATNQKPKTVRTPKNKLDEFKELRHGPEFVERPKRQLQNIQRHEQQQQQQQIINYNDSMNHMQKYHETPFNPARKPSDKQKKPLILHPQPLNEMSSTPNDGLRYESSEFNKDINEINAINQFDHVQHEKMRMADCRSNSVSQIAASRPSAPPPAPPSSATLKKQSSISQTAINNNNANNFNVVQQYQQTQQQTSVTSPSDQEYLKDVYTPQQPTDFIPSTPTSASIIPSYKRSELPPPPSPPSQDQSFDFHKLPSPTAMPPPPAFLTSNQQPHQDSDSSLLPPPPPLPDSLLTKMLPFPNTSSVNAAENKDESGNEINIQSLKIANSHLQQPDEESVNSSSTTTTEMNVDGLVTASTDSHNDAEAKVGDKGPIVRDTRSDLLSAIREGIQLRKVEENRLKCEQKHTKKGGALDVQSIMEAAFEMRRKVMENADDDEDDEENNWSD